MKKAFMILSVYILAACSGNEPGKFSNAGYWKSDQKQRIKTFNIIDPTATPEQIKDHGCRQLHTKGQITDNFYYKGDAPKISSSSDIGDVLEVAIGAGFSYRVMYNGSEECVLKEGEL